MVLLSFLAPFTLWVIAVLAWCTPGRRPKGLPYMAEYATLVALALAILGVVQFAAIGTVTLPVLGGPAALILKAGVVNLTLVLLVAFIGWVVIRYSRTYLDGEAQEGRFHALMLATMAQSCSSYNRATWLY